MGCLLGVQIMKDKLIVEIQQRDDIFYVKIESIPDGIYLTTAVKEIELSIKKMGIAN
jgi:hypothetical protein